MRSFVILIALFLSLSIVACGGKENSTKESATPAATPVATTPSPAPTTDTDTAKNNPAEALVKQFMKACKEKDKATASKLAVDKVVNRFFSAKGEAEGLEFQGCNREEKDNRYDCVYSYTGGAMTFVVRGDATTGFKITSEEETAD